MIEKPVVFVLGAGASMDYGYPSGNHLLNEIVEQLKDRSDPDGLLEKLFELNEQSDHMRIFRDDLKGSEMMSVDAFLGNRPKFMNLGKLAITLILVKHEIEQKDKLFDRDKNWYQYLFNKMLASFDAFGENKISFITFNYDRSLEHYLMESLIHYYGKSEKECAEQLCKIPIIHLHGSLGDLPWQSSDGRKYGEGYDQYYLYRHLSENIIIVTEGKEDTEQFGIAFDKMQEAQAIYFIGFGYHESNLRRLKLNMLKKMKNIKGTCLGMGDVDIHEVNYKWQIDLPNSSYNAYEFLRNEVSL